MTFFIYSSYPLFHRHLFQTSLSFSLSFSDILIFTFIIVATHHRSSCSIDPSLRSNPGTTASLPFVPLRIRHILCHLCVSALSAFNVFCAFYAFEIFDAIGSFSAFDIFCRSTHTMRLTLRYILRDPRILCILCLRRMLRFPRL